MNLTRNSEKARQWIEAYWLPIGWKFGQNHIGQYLKIEDHNDGLRTICHVDKWRTLVSFCEGVNEGRRHAARCKPAPKLRTKEPEPDKPVLLYHYTNSGFCQTHYIRKEGRKKIYYCLQEQERNQWRVMVCSKDGEPSHEAGPVENYVIERGADVAEPYLTVVNQWLAEKGVQRP